MIEKKFRIEIGFPEGSNPDFSSMRRYVEKLKVMPDAITKHFTKEMKLWDEDGGSLPLNDPTLSFFDVKRGLIQAIDDFMVNFEEFQTEVLQHSRKYWVDGEEVGEIATTLKTLIAAEVLDRFGCSCVAIKNEANLVEETYPNPLPYTERPQVIARFGDWEEKGNEHQETIETNPTFDTFAFGGETRRKGCGDSGRIRTVRNSENIRTWSLCR